MPPASKSPHRRTHVTTACTACRESKIRCDGNRPECGACMKSPTKECSYQDGDDRRRISLRKAIQIFSKRLHQLESFIKDNGLESPAVDREDEDDLAKMLQNAKYQATPPSCSEEPQQSNFSNLVIDSEPINIQAQPQYLNEMNAFPTVPTIEGSRGPLDIENTFGIETSPNYENYDMMEDSLLFLPSHAGMYPFTRSDVISPNWNTLHPDLRGLSDNITGHWDTADHMHAPGVSVLNSQQQQADLTSRSTDEISDNDNESVQSNSNDQEEVISQISERLGSLQAADGGELRYFGATSNLNILCETVQQMSFEIDTVRARGEAQLKFADLDQTVEPSLISQLVDLYFSWQNSSIRAVEKTMYEDRRARYQKGTDDSTFYSETLTNAMCAVGALYNNRRHPGLPVPLSEFFVQRALIWLEIELDSPRVATIQALIILSNLMASSTKDSRGWLYSGMSIRLTIDLGLHIDMKPYVESGRMDEAEAEVRKITFWGAFIVDKLWGFYLGRPPIYIQPDIISVGKPSFVFETDSTMEWKPYGLSESAEDHPEHLKKLIQLEELLSYQLILLCEIVDEARYIIFSSVKATNKTLQATSFKTTTNLWKWFDELPQVLQVSLEDETKKHHPHVLMLHMKYSQFHIYLHRPFISKYSAQPYPPVGPGHIHARNTAIQHAVRISRLLQKYKTQYSLQHINIEAIGVTFSAALILIFATVSEFDGDTDADLRIHLSQCCNALADLGKTFQNASRALDTLLSVKRAWQAKFLASAGSKRATSTTVSSSGLRKRSRYINNMRCSPRST